MTLCDLDLLSLYLDGGLTLPARVELESHLRSCSYCSGELKLLDRIDTLLASWGGANTAVPTSTHMRVVKSVERKRRLGPVGTFGRMMPAAVGTTIAALLVLVSVNLGALYQNQPAVTLPTQSVISRTIAKQSARLIRERRTSAILGSYTARPTRTLHVHRLHLDEN